MPGIAGGRPANLHLGKAPLDGFGRHGVESVVVFGRAVPLLQAEVGLIPDLEMADVEVQAVGPAFVAVPDDADADFRPLVVIGRFVDVILSLRVLDALAQPVDNECSWFSFLGCVGAFIERSPVIGQAPGNSWLPLAG